MVANLWQAELRGNLQENTRISFRYDGELRTGKIHKVARNKEGLPYIVLETREGFRSFLFSKVREISIL